ncbi:621_t:CDS:2 [Paraglomus occultum]|uniref:621_t:CDS:1 n=1 Tax=Paraglomus occultum TaxID=144539 RepID=A0A9N8WAU3_9GLOM|nr:621_t:CDS:2 [Paraglomus occultum]
MGKKSKNKTQLSEQHLSVNGQKGGKKNDLPPTPPPDTENKDLKPEEPPNKPKTVTGGGSATERGKKKSAKSNKKKSKGTISKLLGQITLKRLFFAYVFYVVLVCSDITPSELESSPANQFICTNGLSRYILKNDLFKKYIEPSITLAKVSVEEQVQPLYETHGKPVYAAIEPYWQSAYSYYVEYVKIPATLLWRDVKKFYNNNAKEHVDKYYGQLSHAIGPYAAQGKKQVVIVYDAGVLKYKTVILPWYKKNVSPVWAKGWDKSTEFYYTTARPTAVDGWEKTKQYYSEVAVPAYLKHVHPHIIAVIDFIKEKYEILFEDPAERKAKEEAERRAKEEAERKIKEEAERQARAKKEAERRAKEEAERKIREAERKAKEEAERKAKEEAERKAREEAERKAKEEAERKAKQEANAALDIAAKSELERYQDTASLSILDFKTEIENLAKARMGEIATEITNLQSFADNQVSSIKTHTDKLLADPTKNVTDKTHALNVALKEIMDSLKTKSKEIKKKSKEAIENVRSEINIKREAEELNVENQSSEVNFNLDTLVKKYPKANPNRLSQTRSQVEADVAQSKKSIGIITDKVLDKLGETKIQEITSVTTDALERIKSARALSDKAFQQQHEELVKLQFEAELAEQVEAAVREKQDVAGKSADATTKEADGKDKIAKSEKPASDAGNVKIVDEADEDEAVFEKLMAGYPA